MRIGVWVFGASSFAAGIFDLAWREFEPAHQPIQAWGDHIPGITIMAYVAAIFLIAGGASILWHRTARFGGLVLAILYAIFSLFSLPRFVTAPHYLGYHVGIYVGVLGEVCQQAAPAIGALIVYLSEAGNRTVSRRASQWLRWIFGYCSVDFGLTHLTGVQYTAPMVPKWMPLGGNFWTVLTGIAFVLAGLAIMFGIRDALGAWMLGWMLVLFSVLVLIPLIFANPHDHVSWGANAYNLAVAGAAWIVADWLASLRRVPQPSITSTPA